VPALPVPVLVNDRLDVALAAGAAGCHLGAEDFPATEARRLAPPPFILGVSVGSPDEAALMEPVGADYWGVGPCFPTETKPEAGVAIGPAGFARLRALAGRTPCIAIGGVSAGTAASMIAAGACGVATARAVMGAPDPEDAARKLRRAVDSALASSL
jgi:thiamine-phosphate diphosphorylase